MLVAAVEGVIDVLLGVVKHALGFTLRELDQVEADLDHDVWHLGHENLAELLVSRSDAQCLDQLDNKLLIDLIVQQLFLAWV